MVMAGADGNAETVSRQWVTSGIFDVLGVTPIAGRTFSAEDEATRANAVVMSEAFWRTRFNADPGVVGREIRFDGTLFTVVGIVPKDFQLLGQTQHLGDAVARQRSASRPRRLHLPGGRTPEARRIDRGGRAPTSEPSPAGWRGSSRRPTRAAASCSSACTIPSSAAISRSTSMLFLGVVGIRAPHLLRQRRQPAARPRDGADARAGGPVRARRRPAAHRPATVDREPGAGGDWRRARCRDRRGHPQRGARRSFPRDLLPASVALTFDVRVAAFCAAAALVRRPGVRRDAGVEGDRLLDRGSDRLRYPDDDRQRRTAARAAGRWARSRWRCSSWPVRGSCCERSSPSKTSTAGIAPRASSRCSSIRWARSIRPTDALQQFYEQVEAEIAAVPGVAGVAWASDRPLDFFDTGGVSFEIVGEPPLDDRERPSTGYQAVSPTYFSTLDLPILAGRAFDERDARDGVPVCIVNEAFATDVSRALTDRPARRAAADVVAGSQAGRARDRGRCAPGEGTAG